MTGTSDDGNGLLDLPRNGAEEQVRRLLADARHDGALPADVAARLDRVLAELAVDEARGPDDPDELAVRRRRRVRGLLVAAAAVAAVGVGLGQVVPDRLDESTSAVTADASGGGDDDRALSQEGAVGGATTSRTGPPAEAEAGSGSADSLAAGSAGPARRPSGLVFVAGRPVRVSGDAFARDALRVRDRMDAGRRRAVTVRDFGCEPAEWGEGTGVAVRYDGRPHVLAFRSPAGDTQVVDLLQCGTAEILRSTTLPAG